MHKLIKYIALKGIRHWILVGLLLLGAIEGGMISAKYSENITDFVNKSILHKEAQPTSIPTPTDSPLIDCYVNGTHVKATQMDCINLVSQAQNAAQVTKTVQNADPLINCKVNVNCGGGTKLLRKSVCDQSICCQLVANGSWVFYESKTKCAQDQSVGTNSNLVNCSIGGVVYKLTKEQCANGSSHSTYQVPTYKPFSTLVPNPTSQILPTNSATVKDPYCDTAASNWYSFKTSFMANQYNNYSSSAEAMSALYSYQQYYQNEANSHGCNVYLSM